MEAAAPTLKANEARSLMLKLAERLPDEERNAFRGLVDNTNEEQHFQSSKSQPAKMGINKGGMRQSKSMNEPRSKYKNAQHSPDRDTAVVESVESIARWDTQKVAAWLNSIGMHEYQKCFFEVYNYFRAFKISSMSY